MGKGKSFDRDSSRGDYGQRGYSSDRGYTSSTRRPPHEPLQWHEAKTITNGGATAVISTAHGQGGKLYSFTVGRAPFGSKPGSKFLTSKDITDAKQLLVQVEAWIEADRNGAVAIKVAKPVDTTARVD